MSETAAAAVRFRVATATKSRAALAFVAWGALAAYATTARAEPRTVVALRYEVAPEAGGCPNLEEFRASVEHQLGYDPFRSDADRRVAVRIARKENGFDGRIGWTDIRGHRVGDRRLSSRSSECGEIAANLAFAIAVQIQLLAALTQETSEPTSEATPGASPTTPTPDTKKKSETQGSNAESESGEKPAAADQPVSPLRRSATPRKSLFVGLGPSLAHGIAPDVTGLGRIFFGGRIDWLSLELGVDAALPVSNQEADGSGFKLNRFAAGAAACGHVQVFAACLTGTVGRLQAHGYGVDQPTSPVGVFSHLGARIAGTLDFGDRYFVSARAEGLVMLKPWAVTLNDAVVWTTPRVGELLGLDFGLIFF